DEALDLLTLRCDNERTDVRAAQSLRSPLHCCVRSDRLDRPPFACEDVVHLHGASPLRARRRKSARPSCESRRCSARRPFRLPSRRARIASPLMSREFGRREFLGLLGAAGVLAACSSPSRRGARSATSTTTSAPRSLPRPEDAPFDTVVVTMMENRSFDHV